MYSFPFRILANGIFLSIFLSSFLPKFGGKKKENHAFDYTHFNDYAMVSGQITTGVGGLWLIKAF